VEDKSQQGAGWGIATALLGLGAFLSPHPIPKLIFSLAAIGTGTMAVDCFTSTARTVYQELAAPREYHQLPAHSRWVKVSRNSSRPFREIRPSLVG